TAATAMAEQIPSLAQEAASPLPAGKIPEQARSKPGVPASSHEESQSQLQLGPDNVSLFERVHSTHERAQRKMHSPVASAL
ncbi:MAG: hypothetical protein ACXWSD_05950, partial [Bdellovibrionota bacterium]